MTSGNIFQSRRLVYRAVEDSDQEFFEKLTFDRVGYINSSYTTNRLAGKEDATEYRKACAGKDMLLGAIICLPTRSSSPSSSHQTQEATVDNYDKLIPMGEIHLQNLGPGKEHHRQTKIGLQLLPEFQGKGYGTEAIRWVLKWAFHHSNIHRVGIGAFEWNEGAIRLYEKIGFVHEGREREAIWHDGRWWDLVVMGMLDREWREMQQKEK